MIIVTGSLCGTDSTIDELVALSLEHVRRSRTERDVYLTRCIATSKILTAWCSSNSGKTARLFSPISRFRHPARSCVQPRS